MGEDAEHWCTTCDSDDCALLLRALRRAEQAEAEVVRLRPVVELLAKIPGSRGISDYHLGEMARAALTPMPDQPSADARRRALAARFHEIYLDTAREQDWPVRPEVDVPFDQLSESAQALDYALADFTLRAIGDAVREERERCLAAVDREEELDGDMPADIWRECSTRDGATRVLRCTVRATKRSIAAAIRQPPTEGEG